MTPTEEFVFQLCERSFLSLWSYANPRGKNPGKELCDVLVVCEPDIIIFSVKEVKLTNSGNSSTDWTRWRKRAVEESIDQIYGAERWIKAAHGVTRKDGSPGLPFPPIADRQIHRGAVAIGSQRKVPIEFGDFGKGFVHVFDDASIALIMNELNTVSDFVSYLSAKEALQKSGIRTQLYGGEEDLLALYLHNNRTFPAATDVIVVTNDVWETFKAKKEYKAKKTSDKASYVWDNLLDEISKDVLHGNLEFGPSLSEAERAIRLMARENRFSRRILGKAFMEFIDLSAQQKVRSRMMESPSGIVYVFLATPHGEDRQFRVAELGNRCFIARGLYAGHSSVVGLATEVYESGKGHSFDVLHLYKPEWNTEDQRHMEEMQRELGFFAQPIKTPGHEDEYPFS